MLEFFERYRIPLDDWVQFSVIWLTDNYRPFFQAIKWPIAHTLDGVEDILIGTPPSIFLILLFLLVWQFAGVRVATFAICAMLFVGFIGHWKATMTTLSLIMTAVIFCILIGFPFGVWAARSNRVEAVIRPVLDIMQTLPGFVYLVPVVMLIGIGNVSGVIVTIVFALPPIIRLTNLGIREVRGEIIEAAYAFGSSPWQVLVKCQIPLAMRTIMTGVNQTLMMALSMVVIASMIAVQGLGLDVLRGIGRLDMGLATTAGIGIVLLAMILDRTTQAIGKHYRISGRFRDQGPIGVVRRMLISSAKQSVKSGANRSSMLL